MAMMQTNADAIVRALSNLGERRIFQAPRALSLGLAERLTSHKRLQQTNCVDEYTSTLAAYGYARAKQTNMGIVTAVTQTAVFQLAEECERDRVPVLVLMCAPNDQTWRFDHRPGYKIMSQARKATGALMRTFDYRSVGDLYRAYDWAKTKRTCVCLWLNVAFLYGPLKGPMPAMLPKSSVKVPRIKPDGGIAGKITRILSNAYRENTTVALLIGDEIRNAPGTGELIEKMIDMLPRDVTAGQVFTLSSAKSALSEHKLDVQILTSASAYLPTTKHMLCLGVEWNPISSFAGKLVFPPHMKRVYCNIKDWTRWPQTMTVVNQSLGLIFQGQEKTPVTAQEMKMAPMTQVGFASSTTPAVHALATYVKDHNVVLDIGAYTYDALAYMRVQRDALVFSNVNHIRGTGLPYAIGVQMARPETKTICIIGDGAFQENGVAALTTAVNQGLFGITVVIFNNQRHMMQSKLLLFGSGGQASDGFNDVVPWNDGAMIPALAATLVYTGVQSEEQLTQALTAAEQDAARLHVIGIEQDKTASNPIADNIGAALVALHRGKKAT